ncbi:MAG TPA: hypothetical protein VFK87_07365 [Steroidobacteraceae bacterium]|nr:hypothetical protein [Steroidobacteraceae bacterium]
MPMHTRRELLRTSLLLGGALCAPRVIAATQSYWTSPGRFALFVGANPAFVDSFQILTQPAPMQPLRTTPTAASAPAVASSATSTLASTSPVVRPPTTIVAASQLRAAYQFSFSSTVWLGGSQSLASWVAGAVNHSPSLQDGSVCSYDFNYRQVAREDWTAGAISQVIWPGCEAASTTTAFPVITVDAATMRWVKGDGSSIPGTLLAPKQKYWRTCDFRVTSNVNINAAQIASVSALTFAPSAYAGSVAFGYNTGAQPAMVLAPFTTALQTGGMLIAGQSTDIAIAFLTPGLTATLATITLRDCRVASVGNVSPRAVVTMNYADASLSVSPVA